MLTVGRGAATTSQARWRHRIIGGNTISRIDLRAVQPPIAHSPHSYFYYPFFYPLVEDSGEVAASANFMPQNRVPPPTSLLSYLLGGRSSSILSGHRSPGRAGLEDEKAPGLVRRLRVAG